ncbi:ATP-dependent helicase, partial [Candidatus Margulisiibacteriota bacterium]
LFPKAKVITLEENYRSTQPILNLTNEVIARSKEKFSKSLYTSKKEGVRPVYVETDSENRQSRFVSQKILELRESGIPLNDIAVLIRSGWHSNDLEVELKASNIPFTKYGGFKFVETAHVKDVISFFKVIYNPLDRISWQRILLLLDGLGPKGVVIFISYLIEKKKAGEKIVLDKYKAKAFYKALQKLVKLIFRYHDNLKSPAEILEEVMDFYKPFFQTKYDDYPRRTPDLESLETISARYRDMETFLAEMSLDPPDSSQIGAMPKPDDEEKLVLSTIHSAKGLEWDTVFLISAIDGYLPSFQSLDDPDQIEEERRLVYVALTRAKQNLFIIKPNLDNSYNNFYRFSGRQFSRLSRFLEESGIVEQFAEKWVLVDEQARRKTTSNLPGYLRTSSHVHLPEHESPSKGSPRYYL